MSGVPNCVSRRVIVIVMFPASIDRSVNIMDAAVTHRLWLVSIVTKQSALYNVRKSVFTSTVVPRCHCCDPAGATDRSGMIQLQAIEDFTDFMNLWFACQIKSFFKPQVVCNSMTTGISYGLQWSLTHGSTVCRQMREVRVMNGKNTTNQAAVTWHNETQIWKSLWDHTPRSLGRDGKDFRYLKICSDEGNHNRVHCQLFRCTLMQAWKQQRMYSMLYAKHGFTDSARVEHLILNTSRSLCELSSLSRSLWYACMGQFQKKYLAKSMRSSCHFKHATKGMVEQNSDLTIPKPDWLRKIRRSCPFFRLSNLQVHHTQCIWFSKSPTNGGCS